ncbi:MAG TPA: class I SAM-dependent methyltransferase [Mycobacterium sp.]|nr:class I SAM-dependent methyltransferase [Mycobacterium sp.]
MFGPVKPSPAICLNMIVRNEAHILADTLDSVAPYISSWVIVDTGSNDGTQNLIETRMAELGIPGELHQRPWRDFGHNRTEALSLAQGHADYIWVIDADDVLVGTPDFAGLTADIYRMYLGLGDYFYWRAQLFRDGAQVRYTGAVHERAMWDDRYVCSRIEGGYHIESRRLGARNQDPLKYARDRDVLLAEVQRDPTNSRSVFYLAQSYFDLGDFANARTWYERRLGMGGWDEEVYFSMLRVAKIMELLHAPWNDAQAAYLRAWEFRPTRAEALYEIAFRYRVDGRYQLGYLFAERAAQIPYPDSDILLVNAGVYTWRAVDEQAVCAYWIGKRAESFALCRQLLARADLPDSQRQRITGNRDLSAPDMSLAAGAYPERLVGGLTVGTPGAEVTVSLIAGPDRAVTEAALNSFLNCCTDVSRVGRYVVFDAGLSAEDRAALRHRYGFLEFIDRESASAAGPALSWMRAQIGGRFWLHLGHGWRFFAPEAYISRLISVLEAEPEVFQVGVNVGDAAEPAGLFAAEESVRRAPGAGRYLLAESVAAGPAMFDTARLDRAGGADGAGADPITELRRASTGGGLATATLDEVLCSASLDRYRRLSWTVSVADILNELLDAGIGRRFAEVGTDNPSPYFDTVVADSKVRLPHGSDAGATLGDHPGAGVDTTERAGGYDVIFIDARHEPATGDLDVIDRCVSQLSAGGVLVIHGSNPVEPGSAGAAWRSVVDYRIHRPHHGVFTVDVGWGCTLIWPSRPARHGSGVPPADQFDWPAFARERKRLLNLVDVAWFRRHLYAHRYLSGSAELTVHTEILNTLISINCLERYLEIGIADGKNLAAVIAPIRHGVDPHPELGGAPAMYPMTSDKFFADGLGSNHYDLVFIDGLHTEEQCRRDLENALSRLSDRGWIVAHDANPQTEWHQRSFEEYQKHQYDWTGTVWKALVRFRCAHPEIQLRTLDLDWGCAIMRRRPEYLPPDPALDLPDDLDWGFFAEHRRELLNLVPAATDDLPELLSWRSDHTGSPPPTED